MALQEDSGAEDLNLSRVADGEVMFVMASNCTPYLSLLFVAVWLVTNASHD